jgi:hypothetical protein
MLGKCFIWKMDPAPDPEPDSDPDPDPDPDPEPDPDPASGGYLFVFLSCCLVTMRPIL